jgi:hypothetical protein
MVIGVFVGVPILLYVLFSFWFWLASDPYNWIPEPEPYVAPVDLSIMECRERGGVPVKRIWDGSLKDCIL